MNAVPTRPQAASVSVKGAAESLAKRGCAHSFPTMTWTTTFMTLGLKKLQHKHDKTWTWTTTSAFGRILPFQTTPHISQQQKCRKQTVPLEPPRSYWEGWQPWQISTCEPICRHDNLEDEPGMLCCGKCLTPNQPKTIRWVDGTLGDFVVSTTVTTWQIGIVGVVVETHMKSINPMGFFPPLFGGEKKLWSHTLDYNDSTPGTWRPEISLQTAKNLLFQSHVSNNHRCKTSLDLSCFQFRCFFLRFTTCSPLRPLYKPRI